MYEPTDESVVHSLMRALDYPEKITVENHVWQARISGRDVCLIKLNNIPNVRLKHITVHTDGESMCLTGCY